LGFADKQNSAVANFVGPHLRPGETIEGIVGQVLSGSVSLTSGWAVLLNETVGLVATDDRLIIVGLAKKLTGLPPEKIAAEYPISAVSAKFSRGILNGRLLVDVGQAKLLEFKVQTIFRDGAEHLAAAITRRNRNAGQ